MRFYSEVDLDKSDGGVYTIVNNVANGVYVGSTHNFYERFNHHERRTKQLYFNCPLYQALREFGSDNFTFTVLSIQNDEEKRLKTEEYLINQYSSVPGINVYNVVKHPVKPVSITPELRAKLSNAHKKGHERRFNKNTMQFEKQ